MKKSVKLLMTVLFLAVLSVIFCVGVSAAGQISSLSVDTAAAADSDSLGAVDWYQSPADGVYYLFLPNGVSDDSLKVWYSADAPVMCGDKEIVSGEYTDVFASGETVTLACGDASYKVKAIESQNIATVYINTQSGSLSAVHADKEYKEPGTVKIIDTDGTSLYDGKLEYIKGRGNSTWAYPKKPYNIKLEKKTDLFGMGKSKKWCLLANQVDGSFIRNALAFDLARAVGVETTTDTQQINLYINGEYEGVYMVTEKVEVGDNRIEIYDLEGAMEDINGAELDTYALKGAQNSQEWGTVKYADIPNDPENITGGYVLELEMINRYPDEASGFITKLGQPVVVKTPEYASKAQVEYISSYWQEFEDALYSSTGYNSLGKHYSEYVDVESLAKMYVVSEFSANYDGCLSSFYFYKDIDGKLVAGPAWDYDRAWAYSTDNNRINHVDNVGVPNLLYIQTTFIDNYAEGTRSLLGQAFLHNDFQAEVEKVWQEKVMPYSDTLIANAGSYGEEVHSSAVMNAVRWNRYETADTDIIASKHSAAAEKVKNYIAERYAFLSNAYALDTYFVKYDTGNYGESIVNDTTVYKAGDKAKLLSDPEPCDVHMFFKGWTTQPNGAGDVYEAGDTITVTEDTVLYANWVKDTSFKGRIRAFFRSVKRFFEKIFSIFK